MLLNKADSSAFSAKGDVGVRVTEHGNGIDHFQNLAVNVPLTRTWASRLVGSRRFDTGFIDFPEGSGPDAPARFSWRAMARLDRRRIFGARANGFRYDSPNDNAEVIVRHGDERFRQFATFGEGALDLPSNLELTLGLRELWEKVVLDAVADGANDDLDSGSFGVRFRNGGLRREEVLVCR